MGHSVILCNTELESRKALDYLQLLYEKPVALHKKFKRIVK